MCEFVEAVRRLSPPFEIANFLDWKPFFAANWVVHVKWMGPLHR
jgi:hypothetical protein